MKILHDLSDQTLSRLHTSIHREWRRRYPRGNFPLAEIIERRRELRSEGGPRAVRARSARSRAQAPEEKRE